MNGKERNSKQSSIGKSVRIEDFTQLSSTPVPKPLIGGLIVILGIVVYGLLLLHRDQQAFQIWIREDGLAEWLTFVVLLMTSGYAFLISHSLRHREAEVPARRFWLFFCFLFLFGAMEEISWGQRIFGIPSPEWFLKHNKQGETTIHNLVLWGVNINKLVFGKILTIILVIYLFIVPLLYRLSTRSKGFVDRWRIPVAQNYQILLFIIVSVVIQFHLGLSKRAQELVELSSCYFTFLILTHPYNQEVISFRRVEGLIRRAHRGNGKGEGS